MKTWLVILSSFAVAFILMLFPLPYTLNWFRPAWVILTLAFWVLHQPQRVGLWMSWFNGLILDILFDSTLGEHALALTLAMYLLIMQQRRIKNFPLWQQGLFIALLVLIYQIIIFIIEGLHGMIISQSLYWMSTISSLLFWPFVFYTLHRVQRRYRLYTNI